MDTVSVGGDRARPDSAGGGRGHSVAHQTNRHEVTGYIVFPGGASDKKGRITKHGWVVDSVGVKVDVPGISGSINLKPREPHGGTSYN